MHRLSLQVSLPAQLYGFECVSDRCLCAQPMPPYRLPRQLKISLMRRAKCWPEISSAG